MKLNMDSRSINNFFFHHIEKLVLAVVLVAVVGVIYLRVGRPGFDENQSPDKLQQVAVTARNNIQSTTWDQVKSETKRTHRGDYDRRVKETQRNAESTPYSVDVPWDKPLGRPGARRSDPEVLKAELLEVSAVVGPEDNVELEPVISMTSPPAWIPPAAEPRCNASIDFTAALYCASASPLV